MEASDSADEVEKKLKLKLLAEESPDCVCCKVWEKSFLGWRPFEGKKEHKKRCETSRVGNQALLRREKTVLAATGDFLFRHYESPDRYMAQYRENHSTSCMERELSLMPVLGVDVPDPYFPKITTSSALMERINIIEALSDFYKVPKDTRSSDVKNICLTGKKADPADRRYLPPTAKKSTNTMLPALLINSASNVNEVPCLPTVQEGEGEENCNRPQQESAIEERCPEITKNDFVHRCVRVENSKKDIPKPNLERDSKPIKESFVLPAARLVCNENVNREREYLQTAFPRIPLWTEYEQNKERKRKEMVLETLRIGKKCKASKKGASSSETHGESLNLRNNLDTREGIPPPSRGNLRLGTTVRPTTNQKDGKRKPNLPQTPQSTYDQLYSKSYLSRSYHSHKKSKIPAETTFIKILGNQTVVPPKQLNTTAERKRDTPKTKIRQSSSKEYQGIPLQYLRKFGRHNFNHVLEARSYKPETRKLGSTIIPN